MYRISRTCKSSAKMAMGEHGSRDVLGSRVVYSHKSLRPVKRKKVKTEIVCKKACLSAGCVLGKLDTG